MIYYWWTLTRITDMFTSTVQFNLSNWNIKGMEVLFQFKGL